MAIPIPGRVAEALRRCTVQITNGRGQGLGSGSGLVVTNNRVITNAHVIRGGPIHVDSWEGKQFAATLLRTNKRRDLACLRVDGIQASAAELADSDTLRPGMPVIAVGNPMGFTGAVSSGIVHQVQPGWIHADVRLAPGNSGGPLANFQGGVIGINTMIVNGGIALAIPSRAVQTFLSITGETRTLGVLVRPVQLDRGLLGQMILELVRDGAAEAASLLVGDILVGSSGVFFRSVDDLDEAIAKAPNSLLALDFYRAGQKVLRHVSVRLHTEPALSAA